MKSPYLISILAGILFGTSYIPFPPWAIFFCFVPLWWVWLEAPSARRVFFTGWLTQFIGTLIGFNWVSYTVHEFGHLAWPFAILTLIGYCSISTASIPIFGVLWWYFARIFKLSEGSKIIALPIFLSIGERTVPMIFDWHFGYTWLWAGFPAFQLADMVGFIGLSSIGLMFNACFLYAWLQWRRGLHWRGWTATPLAVFALMNVAGYWRASTLPQPDKSARFLLVQANIGNEEKLMSEKGWTGFRDTVIDKWMTLTRQGLAAANPPPDFIVWPETAFPEFIDPLMARPYPARLKSFVQSTGVNLITGGYAYMESDGRESNSFFIIGRDGQWMSKPYHKTMLLAFGEYFPGAEWYPQVRKWFPEVANFGRGPGPSVLPAGDLRVGAQICYEGLFDWFARGLANKGAQIMVNVTNDSWYGTWEEPFQHGYMTLARAVEVRLPLVRSTNTGISGVALASGKMLELGPMHVDWQHTYDVPYLSKPEPSIFSRWGYWLLPVLFGLTLVGLPFRRKRM